MFCFLGLRLQQRLDRPALVHRAVALGHLVEGQSQVKYLAGVNLSLQHQADQIGQVAAYLGGAAVEMNVSKEQLLAIELHPVRDADVADVSARAGGTDQTCRWMPARWGR